MAEDTRRRPEFSSDNSSNTGREPAGDPLAELARLIGQNDPFTTSIGRGARKPLDSVKSDDRPAPEWLARPAAPQGDEDYEQPAPRQAYAPAPSQQAEHYEAPAAYQPPVERDYRAPASGYADHGHADDRNSAEHGAPDPHAYRDEHGAEYRQEDNYQSDDRYRVALPSGQYEGDGYYAEDGHMPPQGDEAAPASRRRSGILTIAAVLGLAVIGTAGAFGYRAFTGSSGSSSNPPTIKADPTPPKTVPVQSAATQQGKPIQDRIGALATGERMGPGEEQPVSLPVPSQRVTAPQPSSQSVSPLVAPPPPSATNQPKAVKTITIRQDSVADTGAISPPPGTAPARGGNAKQSGPMGITPQPESAAPNARANTKVASRTPPAASGAYVVQVSAQRTEAEAQSSYQALQSKYPSVLGGRNANIKRVDLADKGGVFFRAQVGSFATSEQATTFCNSLKDVGGQCIVQKN